MTASMVRPVVSMTPPKHRRVYDALALGIASGRWRPGDRLPSEADLSREFRVSRITVGRAMLELQRAGLIERRAGSGTYLRAAAPHGGLSFGLLIPDLGETEIFEAICQGMMASPLARQHALLWGSIGAVTGTKEERALALCRQYIERQVAGVFFAPLELSPTKDEANLRIIELLEGARVPIVLLDRTAVAYPDRGQHDLVGIDNRRAGYLVTEHLLTLGARRIGFVALPHAASTVEAREAGYREALYRRGVGVEASLVHRCDPSDALAVAALLERTRADAIVCANDRTAASLMRTLLELHREVPRDIRLVGIDDVPYAALLPTPLTTLRQPTRALGAAALSTMLERVSQLDRPTRDVLLHGELIVRRSCGATLGSR